MIVKLMDKETFFLFRCDPLRQAIHSRIMFPIGGYYKHKRVYAWYDVLSAFTMFTVIKIVISKIKCPRIDCEASRGHIPSFCSFCCRSAKARHGLLLFLRIVLAFRVKTWSDPSMNLLERNAECFSFRATKHTSDVSIPLFYSQR